MTLASAPRESAAERVVAVLMVALFWAAFGCLAAGLALWLLNGIATDAGNLLRFGLVGLLAMPILRLAAIFASAVRERDWVTLGATAAVVTILLALTIRDATRLQ